MSASMHVFHSSTHSWNYGCISMFETSLNDCTKYFKPNATIWMLFNAIEVNKYILNFQESDQSISVVYLFPFIFVTLIVVFNIVPLHCEE